MRKCLPKELPEWLPPTVWFTASIAAGGIWYFPATRDWLGVASATFATILLAALSILAQVRHSAGKRAPKRDGAYLLRVIWRYPLGGGAERSWATKESAVLLGEIGTAREHPGLGVAIVTSELALFAFGPASQTRIDGLLTWANQHCEPGMPFRMLARLRDPIGYAMIKITPDLRHTMALAIILLRAGREHDRTAAYVRWALDAQQGDGGWAPAVTKADSAVFAALYGAEMFSIARENPRLPRQTLRDLPSARAAAFNWLIQNREPTGLWSTGVLRDRPWDQLIATAWVVQRMLQPSRRMSRRWAECTERAMIGMIRLVETTETWAGTSTAQRFRIEARVAGAVRRIASADQLSRGARALAHRYLGSWTLGLRPSLEALSESELDIGTAAFAAWGMAEPAELLRLGAGVVAEDSA